eukprot:1827675-Rhodomonas_salina.1
MFVVMLTQRVCAQSISSDHRRSSQKGTSRCYCTYAPRVTQLGTIVMQSLLSLVLLSLLPSSRRGSDMVQSHGTEQPSFEPQCQHVTHHAANNCLVTCYLHILPRLWCRMHSQHTSILNICACSQALTAWTSQALTGYSEGRATFFCNLALCVLEHALRLLFAHLHACPRIAVVRGSESVSGWPFS